MSDVSSGNFDVFLSHSSKDRVNFVENLCQAIEKHKKKVWIDKNLVEDGDELSNEIHTGIENSRIFVFVISPNSLTSQWCEKEFLYAKKLGKKIITIKCQDYDLTPKTAKWHAIISNIRHFDFSENVDLDGKTEWFDKKAEKLVWKISENRNHLELGRKILRSTLDWLNDEENPDELWTGKKLLNAESWLTEGSSIDQKNQRRNLGKPPVPLPNDSQIHFIRTSRLVENTRLKIQESHRTELNELQEKYELLVDSQTQKTLGDEAIRGLKRLMMTTFAGSIVIALGSLSVLGSSVQKISSLNTNISNLEIALRQSQRSLAQIQNNTAQTQEALSHVNYDHENIEKIRAELVQYLKKIKSEENQAVKGNNNLNVDQNPASIETDRHQIVNSKELEERRDSNSRGIEGRQYETENIGS
jgi:hypothetical protein